MRAFTIPGALLLVMALAMGCAEYEMSPTEVSSQPQTAKVLAKFPSSWKIAFISDRDAVVPGEHEIFVMNADGSGQTQLTDNEDFDFGPSWSPNGQSRGRLHRGRHGVRRVRITVAPQIAFGRSITVPTNSEIFVMNADGSGQTQLTSTGVLAGFPSWSPNGKQIVFTKGPSFGDFDIFVMNADGSGQTQLTNADFNFRPSWSPNGKQIAFDSDRDGDREIFVMNADGSNQTQLTDNTVGDFEASWSPNGKLIAFKSRRDATDEIYVMNPDGSGQTNLTNSADNEGWPSWSPNGKLIVYQKFLFASGQQEIFVMNADGSGQTRLTFNEASDQQPSWGR